MVEKSDSSRCCKPNIPTGDQRSLAGTVIDMGRFNDKVALVTGAASGIGRATALRFAADGADVVGFDSNADGLDQVALAAAQSGASMTTLVGDVGIRNDCMTAIENTVLEHGRLDVLANVAGIAWAEHVSDVTEEGWNRMMGVNVSGAFWFSQAALPHLVSSHGNLVNVASNAGLMGQAYTVAYSTSKGAVINMTRALAMEYAKEPVRINAVAPGGVDSPMSRDFQMPDDLDYALMQRYIGFRPMADPTEVANVIAFVASDEASRMHGAIVTVDGGLTAG